ncbi:type II toxin-antitoxin system RelE/ParE family toxin [Secundilactobacillus paracollinoides]|uniref:type II toxin-antitoxin system RelE/ParE family toxin n=1 Tax=Secundilactobacillus paracollinoides TaxID=240427 RepID=UPI0014702D7E|nr:type II toxin-antitoxin system RelE/ParE family toxin [Secundilactobacillus paracollinoides]
MPQSIQRIALRKLLIIDHAFNINDLRVPPANHLERLVGNNKQDYSIRINRQYRICFSVENYNEFTQVEIVDYHRG